VKNPLRNSKSPRSVRILGWASALLAIASLGLFIAWAYAMYSYGYWVDEHGGVGRTRPIEYALFGASLAALVGSVWAFVARNKRKSLVLVYTTAGDGPEDSETSTSSVLDRKKLSRRALGQVSGCLAVVSFGFFVAWAIAMYSYGYWIDEHNTTYAPQTSHRILFGVWGTALVGCITALVIRANRR
jgi:hypothetical protein